MADAVIVSTARTPIGKAFRGVFNDTHGADMGAHVIKHAAERAKVELGEVEDVILGCAAPEGTTGSNVARVSAIRAGAPVSVSGVTVNRFCSSGLQTISMAAQRVLVDKVPVMIAGGLESVSLVQGPPGGNKNRLVNPWVQEHVPGIYHSMIQTADTVAARYKISREAQDEYSLQSQLRTAAGQQAGKFDDEIVPMETTMLVTDKNADIAILRTLGALPGSIMQIFMVQGALIGVIGTLAGVVLGVLLGLNVDTVVPAIEHVFGFKFLAKDVYYITELPSDVQPQDVLTIALVSLALSFVATLYPSWRASRVNPAEALRYE